MSRAGKSCLGAELTTVLALGRLREFQSQTPVPHTDKQAGMAILKEAGGASYAGKTTEETWSGEPNAAIMGELLLASLCCTQYPMKAAADNSWTQVPLCPPGSHQGKLVQGTRTRERSLTLQGDSVRAAQADFAKELYDVVEEWDPAS